jgi:hypothetical protein
MSASSPPPCPMPTGRCTSAIWSATSRPTSGCGRGACSGDTAHFVCADDAHGTPIMLAAEKAGLAPEVFIRRRSRKATSRLQGLRRRFDHYHSTHSRREPRDRHRDVPALRDGGYIAGAPSSSSTIRSRRCSCRTATSRANARTAARPTNTATTANTAGDLCPTDLKNPRSVVSGATPVLRESEHYFFELRQVRDLLREWQGRRGACRSRPSSRMAGRRPARLGHLARCALFRLSDSGRAGQVLLRLAGCADRLPRELQGALRWTEGEALELKPAARRMPACGQQYNRAAPLHRQGHHQLPRPVLAGDAAWVRASACRRACT